MLSGDADRCLELVRMRSTEFRNQRTKLDRFGASAQDYQNSFSMEGNKSLLMTVGDAALRKVVGGHFKGYPVTGQNSDAIAAKLACQVG
jgi:hypothetical protein